MQVELTNRTSDDKIGLKYIVTLEKDALNSEVEISNKKSLPVQMTGSILSHLTVSSPEATYALGLERSNYCSKPLFESEFMLSPPDGQEEGFGKIVEQLFPQWGTKDQNNGSEGSQSEEMDEEIDNYKQLSEKLSHVYTDVPRNFTVIDRVCNCYSQQVEQVMIISRHALTDVLIQAVR